MAAEKGYARAQCGLGDTYCVGKGVPQDLDESFHWYLLAANQGYAVAQYNVGNAYRLGRGVDKDIDHAFLWMRKSADVGCREAQYNLGKHINVFMHQLDRVPSQIYF